MMIYRQLGKRRGVRGAMSFACAPLFALLVGAPSELVSAGEFDRSTLPAAAADPAQCDSQGEGPGLKDSGDCKRISGYIAAGARLGTDEQIGGHTSPFGPLDAPEFVGSVRPSRATVIDVPADQERFFRSPGSDDEAH
ncbi:MAG: hypothetical protein WBA40_27315 [Roseiarcus sp.]